MDVLCVTVTVPVAVMPGLSADAAVMVAVPGATPLTLPLASTVATDVSLLLHVTFLLVASAGVTLAVNGTVFLASTVAVAGLTLTPVTATGSDASSPNVVSAFCSERAVIK